MRAAHLHGDPSLRHDLDVEDRSHRSFVSGSAYLDVLAEGKGAHLLGAFFRERIRECNTAIRHDELFTIGLFDDLARALSPDAAFGLIPAAVGIAIEWQDGALYDLAIAQLETIARASGTSEVPPALDSAWDALRSSVESYIAEAQLGAADLERSWSSLSEWYRRC